MKIKIQDVKIGERIRQDFGDLSPLIDSIKQVGLLNPILVNKELGLVNGLRRLEACRELGFLEIEARILDSEIDESTHLSYEYHENVGRKDFNQEELQYFKEKREELAKEPEHPSLLLRWLNRLWQAIVRLFRRKMKVENLTPNKE